jgi:hypothetical protein
MEGCNAIGLGEAVRKMPTYCSNAIFSDMLIVAGGHEMFDVYLSDRRDLLVVRKGFPIPLGDASGRWRKTKKTGGQRQRGN